MSRPLAGYIGYDAEPTTTAAPGIWTLREAEFYQRKSQWPVPFAPDTLTGLQAWYDASDASTLYDATSGGSLVAADGGVARWEDKSGNDRHATQGTAVARPLRKASVQNGLDVMRFDGGDDFLSVPSSTATFKFLHNADSTSFVVAFAENQIGTLVSTGVSSSTVGTNLDIDIPNTKVRVLVQNGSAGNRVIAHLGNSGDYSGGSAEVFSFVLRNAAAVAAERADVYVRGSEVSDTNTETNAKSDANSWSDLRVGAHKTNTSASGFLDGDIAEIIIYDSALSDTDREAVESYLLAKWGIT